MRCPLSMSKLIVWLLMSRVCKNTFCPKSNNLRKYTDECKFWTNLEDYKYPFKDKNDSYTITFFIVFVWRDSGTPGRRFDVYLTQSNWNGDPSIFYTNDVRCAQYFKGHKLTTDWALDMIGWSPCKQYWLLWL